jgi:hypothetical protein
MGSGAAFFDFDNDGDQDLLMVNSDYWSGQVPEGKARPTMHLYQNDGSGMFTDITHASGLDKSLYGMGVAIGDYDNDGYVDLFISALGSNYLFHNEHGKFSDVSKQAGVMGSNDAWSTSASFIDIDNDGDLDLFVANYIHWSREIDLEVDFRLTGIGRAYGPPTAFEGMHCYLYRNNGNGSFTDISSESGIQVNNPASGTPVAKSLAISPIDIDHDGLIDLLVANDTVQNFFFHNLGNGRFEDVGTLYGTAFDRNGAATGAMGVDVAHFRNDQDIGFAIGNFSNEMTSLYVTQGATMPLTDESIVEGIGPASRLALTFGLFFFDSDLDGRLDLLQTNGHLESEINEVQPSHHYRQAAQLFWNCGDLCTSGFLPLKNDQIGDLATPIVGRGSTYADIDGDGDLDVLLTQNGGEPLLLRNDQAFGYNWLRIKLTGKTVNRDAIGAWVEVTAGGKTQRRQVMPTRSYLSQVELPLTFGLGKIDKVDSVRVYWPDGTEQYIGHVEVNTVLLIEQKTI